MADSGTATPLGLPTVPEVNICRKGASGDSRGGEPGGRPRARKCRGRRVLTFVCELEGREVDTNTLAGAESLMCFNGVARVHVLRGHEPARLIGANRQQRDTRRAQALSYRLKMRPHAGIAGKIDRACRGVEPETGP